MSHRIEPAASKHMVERARALRKEASVPERMLWSMLRARRLAGLKFRRQQPIGPYVADYYCERARLVIELDGRSHFGRCAEDAARDGYMRRWGLEVLRIPNDELLRNREGVAETIVSVVEGRTDDSRRGEPSPGPSRGEGG